MRHLTSAFALSLCTLALVMTAHSKAIASDMSDNKAIDIPTPRVQSTEITDSLAMDSLRWQTLAIDTVFPPVVVRDLDDILMSLPDTMDSLPYNPLLGPWVFSGYRPRKQCSFDDAVNHSVMEIPKNPVSPSLNTPYIAPWLHDALTQSRIIGDLMYSTMVNYPHTIQYTYWDLPVPPTLPEDDISLGTYIRSLNLPEISITEVSIPEFEQKKKHWLHNFNTGLQFSQAYVSKNWYQGGNNYLQLLYNFYWDVQLNPVYHPNQIFQSTVSYKLGINSVEQSAVDRKYSISEDNFQYNVKYGFKSFQRWFYTITGLFKTQFMRNYKTNTDIMTASFLSPADLNLGLGMTYSYANQKKTFNLTASIAPLSYNLKVCIDKAIDPTQFNIKPGHKTHNEFGSSGEVNMTWQATSNISMRTRLFAFTDYNYFQGNIETTWDFAINKFLSTQIYANLRYDSSSDFNASRWHHWMLKEILSFGLSYSFSTK